MRPSLRPELSRAAAAIARDVEGGRLRALTITAAARGEGVTTITAHLARELIEDFGLRVLLLDLGTGAPRLDQALAGLATPPRRVAEADIANATSPAALVSLATDAARELRRRLDALLTAAAGRFDIVLVDAPAAAEGLDAMVAARACGQALLVIRAGNLPHETIERLRDDLRDAGVGLFGAILNQRREVVPAWIDRLLR
jgi:Mrp family chromosome partitioning ATPase